MLSLLLLLLLLFALCLHSPPGGYNELRFDQHGFGWLTGEGQRPLSIKGVLQRALVVQAGALHIQEPSGEVGPPLELDVSRPSYGHLVLASGAEAA
eukprot:5162268-Lingulodinium_polyedra.AAC.1